MSLIPALQKTIHLWKLKIGRYEVAACVIIFLAAYLRITLLALGWPSTDSDEATMGLMASHIAYQGGHPVFFYGQGYIGTLEAYLGALLFHLFGPSLFSLRLGMGSLFPPFLEDSTSLPAR